MYDKLKERKFNFMFLYIGSLTISAIIDKNTVLNSPNAYICTIKAIPNWGCANDIRIGTITGTCAVTYL